MVCKILVDIIYTLAKSLHLEACFKAHCFFFIFLKKYFTHSLLTFQIKIFYAYSSFKLNVSISKPSALDNSF